MTDYKNKSWIEERVGRGVSGEEEARNVKKFLSKIGHKRFSGRYIKDLNNPKPQAIMKIINKRPRGHRVRNLIEYVGRVRDIDKKKGEEPLELHLADGTMIKGNKAVKELYEDWAMDFERGTIGNGIKKHRHATHIMFSADTDFKNKAQVLASGKQTAHILFGKSGYEYALALHTDGKRPHIHIVLKDRNRITGKKIDMDRADILNARQVFCDELEKRGIENSATLRRDRVSYKDLLSGVETLNNNKGKLLLKIQNGKGGGDVMAMVRYHGAIKRFEKQVKDNASWLSKNKLLTQLAKLKKSVVKMDKKDFEKMLVNTIKSLGKDGDKFSKDVAVLQNHNINDNKYTTAELKLRRKAIEGLAKKQISDMAKVAKELKYLPVGSKIKSETRKAFKVLLKNVKTVQRDNARGRN